MLTRTPPCADSPRQEVADMTSKPRTTTNGEPPINGDGSENGDLFGGPTASSWREQALTRVAEIENLTAGFEDPARLRAVLAERMGRHLETAREAADGTHPKRKRWTRLKAVVGGSALERTASNLDAAEVDLLRVAPPAYLLGQLPTLLANARAHLPLEDPRRQSIEAICLQATKAPLSPTEKDAVIAATRAANSAARREIVQIRSFRNILAVTAALLAAAAFGLVVLGVTAPQVVPLCFNPGNAVVCPTDVASPVPEGTPARLVDNTVRNAAGPWDLPLVALVGLVAAALSAAVALRNLRGSTTPYALPVALAVLKLPTGALTAVLGLMLMRGDFVPGLSALDSPGQILAWAILFGYAQQLFTRFVDERAQRILNQVNGQEQPRAALPTPTVLERQARTNGAPGTAADPVETAPAQPPARRQR